MAKPKLEELRAKRKGHCLNVKKKGEHLNSLYNEFQEKGQTGERGSWAALQKAMDNLQRQLDAYEAIHTEILTLVEDPEAEETVQEGGITYVEMEKTCSGLLSKVEEIIDEEKEAKEEKRYNLAQEKAIKVQSDNEPWKVHVNKPPSIQSDITFDKFDSWLTTYNIYRVQTTLIKAPMEEQVSNFRCHSGFVSAAGAGMVVVEELQHETHWELREPFGVT